MVQYSIVTYRQNQAGNARMILPKESERESPGVAGYIRAMTAKVLTALVSYARKANCREAAQYIHDFRLWTSSVAYGLTVEIYAVNGRFPFDFYRPFRVLPLRMRFGRSRKTTELYTSFRMSMNWSFRI